MPSTVVTLAVVLSLVALVVWFDARCLADLARTRDDQLRYLTRTGWALLIVVTFPLGPVLYLRYGKVPRGGSGGFRTG